MTGKWTLDSIYKSFESVEYKADKECLKRIVSELEAWTPPTRDELVAKVLESFIKTYEDYRLISRRLYAYSSLTMSADARKTEATKEMSEIEALSSRIAGTVSSFNRWIATIKDLTGIINDNDFLHDYSFFLNKCKNNSVHMLSEKEEIILATLQNTASKAWQKQQEYLTSVVPVDITLDGKANSLPLPAVRNLASSPSAEIRKTAYEAELEHYKKIQDSVAFSLNSIVGEVIATAKLRGYESPLNMTLKNSRMNMKTLDSLMSAVKEFLPTMRIYLKKKSEILGHSNGLPFYDIFAPIGKMNISYTYEEACEKIIKTFNGFSPKLANFASGAFEKGWVDSESREGKRGGAFCANIHSIGESRILLTFDGSYKQMSTLAHELGHGFHNDCLKNEKVINSDYPMPLAETASILCETIISKTSINEANDVDAFSILENELQTAAQVIIDIYSRFRFESNLFKKRESGPLSTDEIKELMRNAQIEAYGDGLDPEFLHESMWICKPHYYSAEMSFYNFPYVFGLLFSKGLYAEYLKKGDAFLADYEKLLIETGKNSIENVAASIGIDVSNIEFWRSSLELIKNDIDTFCNKADALYKI